ncbi:MAG: polysaccharide deacetylase family protein [bacterium]
MPKYCKNHPDIVAEHICHQCYQPICFNCLIYFLDHKFCSIKCIFLFCGKEIGKALYGFLRLLLFALLWPFSKINKINKHVLFELLLLFGLLICLFFIFQLRNEIHLLEENQNNQIEETLIDTTFAPKTFISSPQRSGMVFTNTITIEGECNENKIVALYIDTTLKEAFLPKNKKFTFKDIKLNRGKNKLQVKTISPEGTIYTIQTLSINYALPSLLYLSKSFNRGSINTRQIALTFDGGSTNNVSQEILDILANKNVKATFFLTGQFIKKYKKTVKRIVKDDHEVSNHTWSHPHLTTFAENFKHNTKNNVNEEVIYKQLVKTNHLFQAVTGKKMFPYWRAPYGEYNNQILQWAAKTGYKHIGWTHGNGWEETMDTFDWVADTSSNIYKTADEIVEKILTYDKKPNKTLNGAIILMHLGSERKKDYPHQKLPELIDGLRKKGLELVTISELLENANN